MSKKRKRKETAAAKVNRLHNELVRKSIQQAIKIGKILAKERKRIKKSEENWTQWVADNLNFTYNTANNYIKCWENRKIVKEYDINKLTDIGNFFNGRSRSKNRTKNQKVLKFCKIIGLNELHTIKEAFKVINSYEIFSTKRNKRMEDLCRKEIEDKIVAGEKAAV
ncbi:MAG: DUF3102 domain-containing protein [archaeon]